MKPLTLAELLAEAQQHMSREQLEIESYVKQSGCLLTGLSDWESGGSAEVFLSDLHGKCRVLLDRNVLIPLRDLAKGKVFKPGTYRGDDKRLAAAHFLFFRLADIPMIPTVSVLEGANSSPYWKVLSEWEDVRRAGTMDLISLWGFASGRLNDAPSEVFHDDNWLDAHTPAMPALRQAWEFNLLQTIKFTIIRRRIADPFSAIEAFLDWQFNDYLLGLPALFFFQKAISPNGKKSTLKGFGRESVTNVAWDLMVMQYWHYLMRVRPDGKTYLLCTFDKALRRAASLSYSTQSCDEQTLRQRIETELNSDWGPTTGRGKKLAAKLFTYLGNQSNAGRKKRGTTLESSRELWSELLTEYETVLQEPGVAQEDE